MNHQDRQRQKLEELRRQWQDLSDRIAAIIEQLGVTTDAEQKLTLTKRRQALEAERAALEPEMERFDTGEADAAVRDAMLVRIEDRDAAVRLEAVKALAGLVEADAAVRDAMLVRIEDKDAAVRKEAVQALAGLVESDADVRVTVQARLDDEDAAVRKEAVQALAGLVESDADVRVTVQARLDDEDASVRQGTGEATPTDTPSATSQPPDEFQYDAFISYSHRDSAWVRNVLLPRLEAEGLRICIDTRDFEVGVPSLVNMENAVDHSRKTLLVLTPNWLASEWTAFEALLVQTQDPVGRGRRILPLMAEPCQDQLPARLKMFTYLDLTDPAQLDFQMKRLVDAIRAAPSPEPAPAPKPAPPARPTGGDFNLERGLAGLGGLLAHADAEVRLSLSVLESRLLDNLKDERLYGSNESIRSERARIVGELNRLALDQVGRSFNDLCKAGVQDLPAAQGQAGRPGPTLAQAQPTAARTPPQEIPPNPFGDTGRINDPDRFFDREDVLRQVFEELGKGVNLSLVGDSQVGKSSLLSIICALGPERLSLPPEAFAYLSLEWVDDEDDFYEALCDALGVDTCRGFKLTRALRDKRIVLCLDEIEKMAWEGFSVRLRSQLRGLADGPAAPLKLVIASRSSLAHLFPDSPELDSPLAGICRQLDVLPFSPEVARAFVADRLRDTGVTFGPEEIASAIHESGGHPARLQQILRELYDRRAAT